MYTKENINGKTVEIKQYFAVYDGWEASLKAHAELLAHGTEAKSNVFKDVLKSQELPRSCPGAAKGRLCNRP